MDMYGGMQMMYRFSESDLKILLNNLVIIADSRERVNDHVTGYFDLKKKEYVTQKLGQGDYSCFVKSNEATKPLGVNRDWHFSNDIAIERKNSVTELVGSIKDRDRFENEFARLNMYKTKIIVLVEDANGYENILKGNYRSEYKPASFIGSLETFIARYDLNVQFIDKKLTGYKIWQTMYYHVREILKNKGFIEKEGKSE
jgi:ERCC4-type nuclease